MAENQKKILSLMQTNPNISKQEMATQLAISSTAVDKNISQLKKKGLLIRVGPDKGGHWEIVKNNRR